MEQPLEVDEVCFVPVVSIGRTLLCVYFFSCTLHFCENGLVSQHREDVVGIVHFFGLLYELLVLRESWTPSDIAKLA